jgi:hypothetical protein
MDQYPLSAFLNGQPGTLLPNSSVTIASGQTTSPAIACGGLVLCGLFIPAGFTGTSISFLASQDGTNFFPVKSTTSGTALSYTVAASTYAAIDPKDFQGINFLKIVSGSSEGAARQLYAALKGF